MDTDSDYIVVGKVGSTYGIKGWLKITSYTEDALDILSYSPWYLQDKATWQPTKIEEGRAHGKSVIAKLPGYENPEEARLLTGKNIAVKRAQLPKLSKNEFYWSDLKGMTVINHRDEVLGKVSYVMETGANDVLVVKGDKEHAVPYLDKVINEVDLENKIIRVTWDVI